jgi:hypothetical protein
MRGCYLAGLVEDYCKEKNLDVSEFYKELARIYQDAWGVNIDLQMRENGKWDIAFYLEELGIVERYIAILNVIKKEIINT